MINARDGASHASKTLVSSHDSVKDLASLLPRTTVLVPFSFGDSFNNEPKGNRILILCQSGDQRSQSCNSSSVAGESSRLFPVLRRQYSSQGSAPRSLSVCESCEQPLIFATTLRLFDSHVCKPTHQN